jgi:hypothetical protein
MFLNVIKIHSITGYMFQPYSAIFRQHILMELTALCSLVNSTR